VTGFDRYAGFNPADVSYDEISENDVYSENALANYLPSRAGVSIFEYPPLYCDQEAPVDTFTLRWDSPAAPGNLIPERMGCSQSNVPGESLSEAPS
jgi:hypothetical protein